VETMTVQEAAKKTSDLFEAWSAHARPAAASLWKALSFNPVEAYLVAREALVIAIDQDGYSILTGRKVSSRIRITGHRRFGREEGKSPDPDRMASAAAAALREARQAPQEVCLCIPRAWVLYRTAELPAAVRENLSGAVSFEMDRLTPLPADRSLYDFRVIKESQERLEIALMAARADRITPYLHALKDRGITVSRVIADTTGWATVAGFAAGGKDSVLATIDGGRFEVGRLREGLVRSAVAGTFRSETAAERIAELLPEIESRIEETRSEGGAPSVIVGAADEGYLGLQDRIEAPVTFLRDTDLEVQLPAGAKAPPLAAVGSLLASLVPDPAAMNLLDCGTPKKRATPLTLTVVLVAALAALGIVLLLTPLQIENRRIEEIDRQIAANREEVRKVDALRKEADAFAGEVTAIRNFKAKKMLTMDIMRELTTILPKGTWLTRAKVSESGVDIEGYAASATEILPLLEASPYFIKVEFAAPTFRDARLNSERFVIKMELEDYRPPREVSPNAEPA